MTLSKRFPVGPHDRELVLNVGPRDWPVPRPAERYALVAIGAGAGGLVSAMGTAGLGGRTAILERNLLGGDCLMTLRFSRAVIATGAAPARPPLPGVEEVLTTEDLWNLVELPRRLIVVGAGAIGIELGQAFQRLGSEVVVLERAARGLLAFEEEAATVVTRRLEAEGVTIRFGAKVWSMGTGSCIGCRARLASGRCWSATPCRISPSRSRPSR